ncbi:hypothetical protein [Lacticaseibacillus brantae]|uniref:Uncharacterized protein n=1 Tax=Lacticaseibacillus brantae DSM 23927 TaxID=1423727 RepID=A0A0R2BBP2_9LACO|nr:hypothetical protein [Lacticaseibacillus brantae]KRM73075.1 hypothetical protein FC34_GL000797 [Lacticaseibacillus brantae DSM 23927]
MLDDRLLGLTFTLTSAAEYGQVSFFGIRYQYHLLRPAEIGTQVIVLRHTPRYLEVVAADSVLAY